MMLTAPPLSLYIHIPWCIEKCPYCDFNSHALKHDIPEQAYVTELIKDLDADIQRFALHDRPLHSIFIGGGTPSLFSAAAISAILSQVLQRFEHRADIEITLEANPGTVEADKFIGFYQGGVSRLSIGVQSFASDKLIKLGRIHDSNQAKRAAALAHECGINTFNLDLMHGLPNQSLENALDDIKTAIDISPTHLSWYQLTIEPNTAFHSKPPQLPEDETLWDIQDKGSALLSNAGYQQYEISAFAKPGFECQHNLNYWKYGDYLGIGCGAHGKITDPINQQIHRTIKVKHPKGYLDTHRAHLDQLLTVAKEERPFEYLMNRLRLFSAFNEADFEQTTGLAFNTISAKMHRALDKGLLQHQSGNWQVTKLGHRYLNSLLEEFL
ncbi:radical SAM family heme chaperone HemW [Thalassotalea sp. 1_MG-2023]|uniref:radical SAM family heme chaperone HemW n=1 Tax=Thalassotalea sp. 1_MG-2023 TaxID=3062680 RepID=UPI0026E360B4|nr:radical SAM family heme chaperone HemW [Thalassotalea sp. 1_MG-2023]MDO6426770.1 radical SAM family heme chaperone HemW [Thalassotalea sp. 1_MG-2023]